MKIRRLQSRVEAFCKVLPVLIIILSQGGVVAQENKSPFKFDYFTSMDNLKIRYGKAEHTSERSKGILLLLNGRAEFMEKYQEVVFELINRGYLVMSLDWRGQGLSARELKDREKGYVRTYDDYLSDLNLFYTRIIEPQELPVTLLAHSMGAHLALRFMGDHPEAVKKAVLVSAMVDIDTAAVPRFAVDTIANLFCKAGFSHSYLLGGRYFSQDRRSFKENRLTHDPNRFRIEALEIGKNPDLGLGNITWAWLKATLDSIRVLNSNGFSSKLKTSLLMLSAEADTIVSNRAQQRMCSSISGCTLVMVPGAYHEILHETDGRRELFWQQFDRFAQN